MTGHYLQHCNDTITFDMKKTRDINDCETNKKGVHSYMTYASIYDPLGLINPFVASFKCLFRKVCISKVNWDMILPWDMAWHNIILCSSNRLVVPRSY